MGSDRDFRSRTAGSERGDDEREDRGGPDQRVDPVVEAAVAGQEDARVFDPRSPFPERLDEVPDLAAKSADAIGGFVAIIRDHQKLLKRAKASTVAARLIEAIGLEQVLLDSSDNPLSADRRVDNVREIVRQIERYEQRVKDKMGRVVTIGRVAILTKPLNGRQPCHYCGPCEQGCITFSYFSSPFTTLKAAGATGRMTLITDAVASHVVTDKSTGKASGVAYIDRTTRMPREVRGTLPDAVSEYVSTW